MAICSQILKYAMWVYALHGIPPTPPKFDNLVKFLNRLSALLISDCLNKFSLFLKILSIFLLLRQLLFCTKRIKSKHWLCFSFRRFSGYVCIYMFYNTETSLNGFATSESSFAFLLHILRRVSKWNYNKLELMTFLKAMQDSGDFFSLSGICCCIFPTASGIIYPK